MSTADSRVQVAAELEDLCAPNAPLRMDAVGATWRLHAIGDDPYVARYAPSRVRLHAALVEEFRAQRTGIADDGLAAVATAGPPAAGKSTRLTELGYDATWRRIDPDDFKTRLIEHDLGTGDLALPNDVADVTLSDGEGVMPLELSGLYHRESALLSDRAQEASLDAKENFVVEGTLAWDQLPAQLVLDLADHGYQHLDVVLVEVPLSAALKQALNRWWPERRMGGMGGRFTPRSVIENLYLSESTTLCSDSARALVQAALAADIETTLTN